MKILLMFLFALVAGAASSAEPDPHATIPSLTLRNGQTLEAVQIVSYATDVVMARWEGGRGTIRYDQFPEEWQAKLDELRPAKRQAVPSAPAARPTSPASSAPTSPARPPTTSPASALLLQDIDVRETQRSNDYVYFAWTARVSNAGHPVVRNTKIHLLDKDGFKLDYAFGDEDVLKTGVATVLTGNSLVKRELWEQVDKYRVELID